MTSSDAAPRRQRKRSTEPAPEVAGNGTGTGTDPGDDLLDVIGVQRRAPFGDTPTVGARGTRTQQRILRAALEVFGEVGYHACRVERITRAAGCSRPSFYQYFSSKEDLFRQLAGEVARELFRIADDMGEITPDEAGWHALRAWLAEYSDLRDRYWPVFAAYAAAEGSDDLVASGSARVGRRQTRALAAKIDPSALRVYDPEVVMYLLSNAVDRASLYRHFLVTADAERAPERERMLDCLAEVLHRSLFGRRGGGMVEHRPSTRVVRDVPRLPGADGARSDGLGPAGAETRTKLLDAAAATFAARGYFDARVDDIVERAGTSHGTFYRYFENKDAVFRAVAARSAGRTFDIIVSIPDLGDEPATSAATRRLRAWVDGYMATWVDEGPIFRLWLQAFGRDEVLARATSRGLEVIWGVLARFLSQREFGDVDVDAFLLIAMLDLGGPGFERLGDQRSDLLLEVIRRGFLGVDARL